MRKFTFMIFMSLFSIASFGQLATEGFETWPPTDWGIYNNGSGMLKFWVQTAAGDTTFPAYAGDHAALVDKENVSDTAPVPQDWLVTPQFTLPSNPQLRFFSRLGLNGDQGSLYRIMISADADPSDLSAYVQVEEWTETQINPTQQVYTEKILSLPENLVGQQVYVAFVLVGDDGDRWLIDNVSVVQECLAPENITVDNTGLNTADITWDANGATSWEIEIVPVADAPTGAGDVYNGTLPYQATDLDPATAYKVYVRSICGTNNNSPWTTPITFITAALGETCAAPIQITTLPYSTTDNTANYGDDYEGVPGTSCGNTNNYLNGDDVVYSYTAPADGIISVDITGNGTYAGMFIYDNCADIGTECLAGVVSGGTTDPLSIPVFAVTAGTTYYIVISTWATPQSTPYTLIVQTVNCAPPTNLTVANVDSSSADLSWDANGATSFEIVIQPVGTGIPAGAGTTVTTNMAFDATEMTDGTPFAPSTNYEYYVRNDCGDGTFSAWAGPVSFYTTQIPAALDYTQDFEGTTGWTLLNGDATNKWIIGNAVNNGGANSLYVTNDNGVSNAYTNSSTSVVQAYRDIQMPATVDALTLSFDWRAEAEPCCDYMRVWLVPATFNPTPGTEITAGNSGGIQLGGNFNQSAEFTTEEFYIQAAAYSGQVARLVFEWKNDGSLGPNPPAAVDNINLSLVTCPIPSNLTASDIALNGATFAWDGPTSVSPTFDYYITTSSTAPDETTPVTDNVSDETVTLDDLDNATTYYFWVRSNCGNDDASNWVGPVIINTLQVPADLDYAENFDGTTEWTLNSIGQPNKWVIGTAVNNGGTSSLYITNDEGVTNAYSNETTVSHAYRDVQMPTTVEELNLSFDWRSVGETNDYLRVWMVPATFLPTPGTQITAANSGGVQVGGNHTGSAEFVTENYIINAETFGGQVMRLVFEWRNNAFTGTNPPAAVDNINLSFITCPAPDNLSASNVTLNTADVAWDAPVTVTPDYDYYISTSNTAPEETTDPTDTVSDPNVSFDDLEDSTTYYVWVRSNCGNGDHSYWVGPQLIMTPQIPADMNFADDFDTLPSNWSLINGEQINKWYIGSAVFNSPDNALYISNDNGVSHTYTTGSSNSVVHAYRDIQMPATITNDLVLSFDWLGLGESSYDYLRVWLVPVAFNPTPGTQITTANGQQIGGNFNQESDWTSEMFIFDGTAYAGQVVRLVFEWRNDGSGGTQPPAAVDNVDFRFLTCPQPTDLLSTGVQGSSYVELSWTPAGTETQWEIVVQEMGSGAPGDAPEESVIVTDDPTYTLEIESGVYYEFYVRAICSDTDSSFWSGPQVFSIFNPPGCANVEVFDPEQDIILPGSEYVVCPGEDNCIPLSANYMLTGETTSYEIEGIDYAPPFPFTGGTPVSVGTDDVWSPTVELPFEFCFFGEIYSEVLVGSNGVITFNSDIPNHTAEGYCPYSFDEVAPDPNFPILNAIYGVYQDIDPSVENDFANPDINYQVLGNYPCRALVVNFSNVAQFGFECKDNPDIGAQTTQIVLYEISNVIEIYVGRRVPCEDWQNGAGIIGLQNAGGTEAFVPDGRNTGPWTAIEEAWRFTPNGNTNVVFEWLQDGVSFSDDTDITVCVSEPTVMTARATYTNCNGELLVKESDVTIRLAEEITVDNLIDLTACSTGEMVSFDLNESTVDFLAGLNSPENFTVTFYATQEAADLGGDDNLVTPYETNASETIYVRVQENGSDCYSTGMFDIIITNNPPQYTIAGDLDICEGQTTTLTVQPINFEVSEATYAWTLDGAALPDTGSSIVASETGIYEVSVVTGCEATEAVQVTVYEIPVADVMENVTECDVFELPVLSTNNIYYTGPDATGDMLAAGTEITTDQTIYIFAQVPGTDCSDESSFTVDIIPSPVLGITGGCENNQYVLEVAMDENYNEQNTIIEWTNPQGATIGTGSTVIAEEEGEYMVTVTPVGDVSCPAVLTLQVDNVACLIPRGISPNGDGMNDEFDLTGFNVTKIGIFNRYGKEVYSQSSYNKEWHGQDKGGNELPTGTYFYSIELGDGTSKTGWVYINRED
ncbi:fibronectin type III domain-containing protein [Flavobacterium alkalisoli]|nr:fibronectin type III domain-containing protein [Flavobacterium alkalisoli]